MCIMPGVTIGKGSVVDANLAVIKDVELFSMVVEYRQGRLIRLENNSH